MKNFIFLVSTLLLSVTVIQPVSAQETISGQYDQISSWEGIILLLCLICLCYLAYSLFKNSRLLVRNLNEETEHGASWISAHINEFTSEQIELLVSNYKKPINNTNQHIEN
jgi:D-alanyl-lipoteichoic acid acyltransferase DltB (MBOAT superfamily)